MANDSNNNDADDADDDEDDENDDEVHKATDTMLPEQLYPSPMNPYGMTVSYSHI